MDCPQYKECRACLRLCLRDALTMFVISEAEAAGIRTDYEQRGEFLAAVELRRLFASAATLFLRSPPVEQSFRKCCPEWAVFNYVTITEPARLSGNPIKPSQIEFVDQLWVVVKTLTEVIEVTAAGKAHSFPAGVCQCNQKCLLPRRSHPT